MTTRLLCLIALPAIAFSNGPAWVSELSDTSQQRADVLSVTIPVGSHLAAAVHNTDAVEPQCPEGVTATVRVVWFEHRTVYRGMPEEREASIPYYLPEPIDCAPTGAWVVELKPQAAGTYTVPVVCNTNTVTVHLRVIDLPQSDIGYGFYTDHHRFPDITREPEYDADMAAHGMNTFTPYAREIPHVMDNSDYARILAWHIDTAIEQGLCDVRFPLLCLAIEPDKLASAKAFARNEWPELIGYNYDEPAVEKGAEVAEYAAKWHAVGARTGTAIEWHIAQQIGDPLDILVIHMDGMTAEALQTDKDRWLYNCSLRGSNAPLHRYWTGVYTWAVKPRVALTWTYCHDHNSRIQPDGTWNLLRVYDTASCDRNGLPLPTVALEAMQEGIIDSRLLQELERRGTEAGRQYLDALRASVELDFWKDGRDRSASGYVWDEADLQVPAIDCCKVRRDVLRLLGEE